MKKIIVAVSTLLLCCMAMAKPLPFMSKKLKAYKRPHRISAPAQRSEQYTDFTGHWQSVGQCEEMNDMTIENDRDSITIDGEELEISAINHLGINAKEMSASENMLIEWIDEGKTLHFSLNGYSVDFDDTDEAGLSMFYSEVASGKMFLSQGKLHVKMYTKLFMNGDTLFEGSDTCTFQKAS